jgi:hypothetical protein
MSTFLRHALVLSGLLVPFAARPQAGGKDADQPYVLRIKVGDSVTICGTGTIVCPAGPASCEDPSVATGELTAKGLAFKGLKPGTTICSARGSGGQGLLRIYRVVVEPGRSSP